ncbi:hypothetical protein ACQHIH_21465 (plasmid) [Xanthomonas sontii]|uniref:hypothetical protein n=1 Tax=Xanthomonas sontii TaxID=2650745 RepID=UPI003F84BFE6
MTTDMGSDELFAEIAEALEITGFRLTSEQAQELLVDDGELLETIDEWGLEDTDVLGQLADLVSQKLINEPWPTFGDERYIVAFERRLKEAAMLHGYALINDDDVEE